MSEKDRVRDLINGLEYAKSRAMHYDPHGPLVCLAQEHLNLQKKVALLEEIVARLVKT
jgi:hypothetical protein